MQRRFFPRLCLSFVFLLALQVLPALAGDYLVFPRPSADTGLRESAAVTFREAGFGEDRIKQTFPYLNGINTDLDETEADKLGEERPDLLVIRADTVLHPSVRPSALSDQDLSETPWHVLKALPLQEYADGEKANTSSVLIFVIDTGADTDHPDLQSHLDTTYAKHFYLSGGTVVSDDTVTDGNGHGSEVTGTIVGTSTGVAPELKVVPVRAATDYGNLYLVCLTAACDYIAGLEDGALSGTNIIINLSYNSSAYSYAQSNTAAYFDNLLSKLKGHGILFVSSAGNNGIDADSRYVYPTRNESNNYVAAASVRSDGILSGFSNYGDLSVEVAAPGSSIYTTNNAGSYSTVDGTSFASPFTAGVAGLIWAIRPSLKYWEVRNLLINTVSGKQVSSDFITDYSGASNDFTGLIDSTSSSSYEEEDVEVISGKAMFPGIIADIAYGPSPANGEEHVPFDASLEWQNDSGSTSFDLYFGTSEESQDLVATGYTETSMNLATIENSLDIKLGYETDCYWKVDTHPDGNTSTDSVWRFTTVTTTAYDHSPVGNATNVSPDTAISWSYDIAGSTFDVYFGSDRSAVENRESGALIASGISASSVAVPETLDYGTTYYWRVVTHFTDEDGRLAASSESVGDVQSFTTEEDEDSGLTGSGGGGGCNTGFPLESVLLLTPVMFAMRFKKR